MPMQQVTPEERKWRDRRRGVRMNSRVEVGVEWQDAEGNVQRFEAHTRIVGPYGCLVVLPQNLELDQPVQLTNLSRSLKTDAVVVWKGRERAEGWELGIEILKPEVDFWGLDL